MTAGRCLECKAAATGMPAVIRHEDGCSAKTQEPSAEGLRVARRYARWHLGFPEWADSIIDAYLNPERAMAQLDEEEKS